MINKRVQDFKNKFSGCNDLEIISRLIWDDSGDNKVFDFEKLEIIVTAGEYQVTVPLKIDKDIKELLNFTKARIKKINYEVIKDEYNK